MEFNLLLNHYEDIRNNSLNLYRCTHFKSGINSDFYKYNKKYKEIDQEKELLINKLIKTGTYKNILTKYAHILEKLENKIIYNYFDEIINFLFEQNNIKTNHIDIFGIIEYTKAIESMNLYSIKNNKNQLSKDTIF